jgi:ATP-dependent protease ClpP protease subunit
MPFGPDCEYADFAECVRKNGDRDDPQAYCAAIQRRTEEHCMSNQTVTRPAAVDEDARPRLRTVRRPVAKLNPRWYRITNKTDDLTIVDIYDEIGWFGVTAVDFLKDLRKITTPNIELHINSPGGDVFDAVAIYTSLRQHDAQVHVVIDSLAASAASFIAMAGDKITATANAMLMIHDATGLVIGNAVDMREMADLLDKHSDNIASIYAARAGGDVASWRDRMADEVWYNAEEAHKAGLVDEIQGEGQPVEDAWDLSIFTRPPQRPSDQQPPAEAPSDDAPAPDDDPVQPDESAHPEDAPQEPTATATNGGGSRRQYLGEAATWYLPPRKEHI